MLGASTIQRDLKFRLGCIGTVGLFLSQADVLTQCEATQPIISYRISNIYQISLLAKMGCARSNPEPSFLKPTLPNPSGVLKLTLTNAVLFHQAGTFKMDPYITLKLGHQTHQTKTIEKGGKKPTFDQSFSFYINAREIKMGRNLQINMWDRKKIGSDNFIGFGQVDLNPVIGGKKLLEQFRCMLSFQHNQAGFINITAQFVEQRPEIIHFRFDRAVISRKTSTFGGPNCWLQITIGEQIDKTVKKKGSKNKPPEWSTQVMTFQIIKSIPNCTIRVMDDDIEIGSVTTTTEKFLTSSQELTFTEEFTFQNQQAGTLVYRTIKAFPAEPQQGYNSEPQPAISKRSTISSSKKPIFESKLVPSHNYAYFDSKMQDPFTNNPAPSNYFQPL